MRPPPLSAKEEERQFIYCAKIHSDTSVPYSFSITYFIFIYILYLKKNVAM